VETMTKLYNTFGTELDEVMFTDCVAWGRKPVTIYVTADGKYPRHGWRGLWRKKKLGGLFAKSLYEAYKLARPGDTVSMEQGTWTKTSQMLRQDEEE